MGIETETASQKSGSDHSYITRSQLETLVNESLEGKFTEHFKLHISDEEYFLPSVEDSRRLMQESGIADYQWYDEVFDCDDFAIMLKAHFCKDAYKHNKRRHSHCLGIVWGMVPRPHALNWVVNDDMKLRFIDPMYGDMYLPEETARYIWMMII